MMAAQVQFFHQWETSIAATEYNSDSVLIVLHLQPWHAADIYFPSFDLFCQFAASLQTAHIEIKCPATFKTVPLLAEISTFNARLTPLASGAVEGRLRDSNYIVL